MKRKICMAVSFLLTLAMTPTIAVANEPTFPHAAVLQQSTMQHPVEAANSTDMYATELRIAGLDGSETWLNRDYSGYYRVVIGGGISCGSEAYKQALTLSKNSAYKDVQFFALDVEGDRSNFSQKYGQSSTKNVIFASTDDYEYNNWFSRLLFNPYSPFWVRAPQGSVSLPYIALLDKDGKIASATAETQDIADLISENFGIKISQSSLSSVTHTRLGSGYTVHTSEAIDQRGISRKTLDLIKKWRRDALMDGNVKIYLYDGYITIREFLQNQEISEADYLNPQWSQHLEYIALQRVIEAYDASLDHSRPNGTHAFTARKDNQESTGEILGWGYQDIADAINVGWAGEKADYIKQIQGKDHGPTGHYLQLIHPGRRCYGFASGSAYRYGTAFAGETTSKEPQDGAPTNLYGTFDFEVNISEDRLNQGVTLDVPASMNVGASHKAMAKLKYMDGRYELRGTWTSSDPSVLSVESGGALKALKSGRATVTLSSQGKSYSTTVSVVVPVSSVSVSGGASSLQVGGSTRFTASVSPADATDRKVVWSSSDPAVATVDASGQVKALKAGTVTVTAKAGGKSASVKVTVKTPVIA
ncbi:internalin A, partial [Bifidobacterium pseudolongum subsp. globosum]